MKKLLLALGLIVCALGVSAQNISKVTTLVIRGTVTNSVGGLDWISATNSIQVLSGEAVRVAALRPRTSADGTQESNYSWFVKSGGVFRVAKGDVIEGPAVFWLRNDLGGDVLLTLEFYSLAVDPSKTLIVTQSSNSVAVAMEWSTNLVQWSEGTNGVYSTPDAAKFFRVKVAPLP